MSELVGKTAQVQEMNLAQVKVQEKLLEIIAYTPIIIGTATPGWNDPIYERILRENFNLYVCENACKVDACQPSPGKYQYNAEAQQLINFCKSQNKSFKHHTLSWHSQLPAWLTSLNNPDRQRAIREHVRRIARMASANSTVLIDVVNECLNDPPNITLRDFWSSIGGVDFISELFTIANQEAPNATLVINEYNVTNINAKSDALFNLCKQMRDRGIPIHQVGFQTHEGCEYMNDDWLNSMKLNMQRFAGIGMTCTVSELDITCDKAPGRSPADKLTFATTVWYKFFKCALSDLDICKNVTLWGFASEKSWIRGSLKKDTISYPCCPWLNNNETPIVDAIRRALTEIVGGVTAPNRGWTSFGTQLVENLLTYNRQATWSGPQCTLPNNTLIRFISHIMSSKNVTLTLKSSRDNAQWDYQQIRAGLNGKVEVTFQTRDFPYNILYFEGPDQYTDFAVAAKSYANGQKVTWSGMGCGLRPITSTKWRSGNWSGPMIQVPSGHKITFKTSVYSSIPLILTVKWSSDGKSFQQQNLVKDVSGNITRQIQTPPVPHVFLYFEGPPTNVDFSVDSPQIT
jgi:endo-1,4-beta-xylanase